ncbi:hypothetical protein EJ04DRAFT_27680 [Polyplosphaeria fusca]|uniref:Uncharacterized protein n=1 Tax=Polyplosphaeria fusca TaxID=682080 RepID=A0A9P4R8U5_9PLEO|nr:hypothetical protein EJ04DRAFT_27680 [Polyplosphaeria fusca]
MSNAPLTPVDDPEPTAPVIDYSLAAVPYNEAYENDLMKAILYPSSKTPAQPPSNPPPHIAPTSLPVPLDSPLRTYPSAVPGIFLTHENGHFTGGPGLTPAAKAEYSKRFIAEHNIKTAEELERVRAQLIAQKIEEAKARARAREAAIRKNAEIDKRIQELEVQRSAEMRVAERVKQDKQRRRQ